MKINQSTGRHPDKGLDFFITVPIWIHKQGV